MASVSEANSGLSGDTGTRRMMKASRRVEREHVVEMKCAVVLARVIGKQAHQPRLPVLIKTGGETGGQIRLGVNVNFIRARRMNSVEPAGKPVFQIVKIRTHSGATIHRLPPIMSAACRKIPVTATAATR